MNTQKKLALALIDWHGGMSSGLYAVGSCMLSDSEKGIRYSTDNHPGHLDALKRAISELRTLKEKANYPEAVTAKDERECNALAAKLEKYLTA
jgi:hypothetical protein